MLFLSVLFVRAAFVSVGFVRSASVSVGFIWDSHLRRLDGAKCLRA